MKSVIAGLGLASLLALGSTGVASAKEMMHKMTYAECNTQYSQCIAAADYTIAATPAAGLAKIQANMAHAQQCAATLNACYASMK